MQRWAFSASEGQLPDKPFKQMPRAATELGYLYPWDEEKPEIRCTCM